MAGRNCTRRGSSSFGSLNSVAGSFQDFSARFITNSLLEQGAVVIRLFAVVTLNKLIQLINNKNNKKNS
jgi:hypothetical protein